MKLSIRLFVVFSFFVIINGLSIFAAEKEIVAVKIAPLSSLVISGKRSAPANIVSLNHAIISAEITGRAMKYYVEVGDVVKKGQKLLSLDCRRYILAKKQAVALLKITKTQLHHAKKQLIRNRRLIKQGTIPREIFDKTEVAQLTALADIELKNVAIETAQLAIDRCQIKAPFSGQITKRLVQKGQLVIASTPLFRLIQNNQIEIKADLSPLDVQNLQAYSKLDFVVNGQYITTKVRSIIQKIDEVTRTQEVRLSIPKEVNLAAGLSGRIEWTSQQLMLPPDYILRRGGKMGVMLAKDIVKGVGLSSFFVLEHAREGQSAEIHLPAATLVIKENQYRLNDGQKIKIIQ